MAKRKISRIKTYEQAGDFLRMWGQGKPNEGVVRELIRKYGDRRVLNKIPFPARTAEQYSELMAYGRRLKGVALRFRASEKKKSQLEEEVDLPDLRPLRQLRLF